MPDVNTRLIKSKQHTVWRFDFLNCDFWGLSCVIQDSLVCWWSWDSKKYALADLDDNELLFFSFIWSNIFLYLFQSNKSLGSVHFCTLNSIAYWRSAGCTNFTELFHLQARIHEIVCFPVQYMYWKTLFHLYSTRCRHDHIWAPKTVNAIWNLNVTLAVSGHKQWRMLTAFLWEHLLLISYSSILIRYTVYARVCIVHSITLSVVTDQIGTSLLNVVDVHVALLQCDSRCENTKYMFCKYLAGCDMLSDQHQMAHSLYDVCLRISPHPQDWGWHRCRCIPMVSPKIRYYPLSL